MEPQGRLLYVKGTLYGTTDYDDQVTPDRHRHSDKCCGTVFTVRP